MPTLFGGRQSDTATNTAAFSCLGRERNLTQCRNFTLPQCIHAGVYCFGKAPTHPQEVVATYKYARTIILS